MKKREVKYKYEIVDKNTRLIRNKFYFFVGRVSEIWAVGRNLLVFNVQRVSGAHVWCDDGHFYTRRLASYKVTIQTRSITQRKAFEFMQRRFHCPSAKGRRNCTKIQKQAHYTQSLSNGKAKDPKPHDKATDINRALLVRNHMQSSIWICAVVKSNLLNWDRSTDFVSTEAWFSAPNAALNVGREGNGSRK